MFHLFFITMKTHCHRIVYPSGVIVLCKIQNEYFWKINNAHTFVVPQFKHFLPPIFQIIFSIIRHFSGLEATFIFDDFNQKSRQIVSNYNGRISIS